MRIQKNPRSGRPRFHLVGLTRGRKCAKRTRGASETCRGRLEHAAIAACSQAHSRSEPRNRLWCEAGSTRSVRLRAPRPRDLGSRRTNARETRLSTKPHRLKCAARLARSLRATLAHAHAKETAGLWSPSRRAAAARCVAMRVVLAERCGFTESKRVRFCRFCNENMRGFCVLDSV